MTYNYLGRVCLSFKMRNFDDYTISSSKSFWLLKNFFMRASGYTSSLSKNVRAAMYRIGRHVEQK